MNNIYDMVLDRDGVPWFAYRDKYGMIFRYDGSTSVVYSGKDHDIPYSQFTNSFRDSRGNLWFGTQNAGIVRFDGSTFKTFTPQETPSGAVAMAIDTRGVVWVAANGLLSFDGNEWKTYSTADGPSDTVVRCITACDDGTVWFGTTMGTTVRWRIVEEFHVHRRVDGGYRGHHRPGSQGRNLGGNERRRVPL